MPSERERDADTDRWLRDALRAEVGEGDQSCPDAETLAAYCEHRLSERERDVLERHLSQCARCQAALAVLAELPAQPSPTPVGATWLRPDLLKWLVPPAAAAIILVVYVAVNPAWMKRAPESAAIKPSAILMQRSPEPPSLKAAPEATRADAASAGESKAESPAPAPSAPRSTAKRDESRLAKQGAAPASPVATPPALALRTAPPPAAPAPRAAPVNPPANAAAAPPGQFAGAARGAIASDKAQGIVIDRLVSTYEVAAPGNQVQWHFGSAGFVARSVDGGKRFVPQSSGVRADLLAAAAPTPTACWIVGRAGTVLRTTDGEHWQVVPFVEGVDLLAVQSSGPLNATVSTSDNRRFTTSDGGRTWTKQ